MNEKPTPSDVLREMTARTTWECAHAHLADPPQWPGKDPCHADLYRADALTLLTTLMPQLSADVLHHAADELNLVSADEWTRGDCVNWLRRQAEAVLT